jgi:hypothetical protein
MQVGLLPNREKFRLAYLRVLPEAEAQAPELQ